MDLFFGAEYEITRVVAAVEDDHYLVGTPADALPRDVLLLHMPGLGEVSRDLSFDMHDLPFQPIRFPVTYGDEWTTPFDGFEGFSAVVSDVTATTAEVQYAGQFTSGVATYDATVGEFVRMHFEGYGTVEVLEHGHAYSGDVLVPAGQDLVVMAHRSFGALSPQNEPAAPVESVDVPEGYDELAFFLMSGNFLPPDSPSGFYVERATAPDGTVYEHRSTPADGPGWHSSETYVKENPEGTWRFEHVAGGPGWALAEGIAFRRVVVTLP